MRQSDMEMQNDSKGDDLRRRARFYLFGRNLARYTFSEWCDAAKMPMLLLKTNTVDSKKCQKI